MIQTYSRMDGLQTSFGICSLQMCRQRHWEEVLFFEKKGPPQEKLTIFYSWHSGEGEKEKNRQFRLPQVCPDKYFSSPRLSIFHGTLS
jgi:hypothetical protein